MSRLGLILALLGVAATVAPIPTMAGDLLPFKGHFDGTVDHETGLCAGLWATMTGGGTATHLGRVTSTASHCLNPNDGVITDGTWAMFTPTGDSLTATYTGQIIDPNPERTLIRMVGQFTGGTGRYAHASGDFTGLGIRTGGDIWHANLTVIIGGYLDL